MKATKLRPGDQAPDFRTIELSGEHIQISKLNTQGLWIALYRYSSCPMCNMHFDDVVSWRSILTENNIQYVAVFESAPENFPKKLAATRIKDITVVPNPNGEVYDLYGAEKSWMGFVSPQPFIERAKAGLKGYMEGVMDGPLDRVPAHFLVLPNGQIHTAYYGKNIGDNIKWRDLQPFFTDLKNPTLEIPTQPRVDIKEELRNVVFVNSGLGKLRTQPPPVPGKGELTASEADEEKSNRR